MAEETQREPRSLYLMYKIAIQSDDREAATTCLEGISKAPEPIDYLYSCCLEAQKAQQRDFAIEALGKLLEKNAQSPSTSIQLPALLRCSIRLMIKDMETQDDDVQRSEIVNKLCDIFEQGTIPSPLSSSSLLPQY